jgi:cytoskeletal protein CcmA (bactofilin family)
MKHPLSLFTAALLASSLLLPQAGQAQGKIYFVESGPDKIRRANLDGSSPQDLLTLSGPHLLALDFGASTMYFSNDADGKIHRANLDGTGIVDLVTGLNEPGDVELDLANGKIYWADPDDFILQRADLDGGNVEKVFGDPGPFVGQGIALNAAGDSLYFIYEPPPAINAIVRLNLSFNDLDTLVTTGLTEPFDLELDAGSRKIYWTDTGAGTICRGDIDGKDQNLETLVTGLITPRGLALDVLEGKMYWSDMSAGKIQRSNLDGSNVEDVLTGLTSPRGIALDVAASPNARFVQFSGPGGFVVSRSKLVSQGNIFSNANLHFQKGDPTVFNGNLFAVGNIIIDKDNTINGNLRAGGTITIDPKSTVNGTIAPSDPVQPSDPINPGDPLCAPTDPIQVINIGKGQSRTLFPGDPCKSPGDPWYDVNVGNSSTLNLSSGTYVFSELETQSESIINFDVSNGAVVLNVHDKFALGKKVQFNISPGGEANSHLVTIFAFQSSKVAVEKGGYVLGNLNAPNAEVSLGKNVSLRGAVGADKVSVDRDVIFLHHSSPGVLPKQVLEDEERGEKGEGRVVSYELAQNYPNPFLTEGKSRFAGNPSTTIKFALPEAGEVSLRIYNMNGQLVRALYSGAMPSGRFSVEWDGKNESGERVASGVYVYEMRAGGFVGQRKLVLMR